MLDVLIIGGGVSGVSCALLWGSAYSKPFASDKKTTIPTKNGTIYTFGLDGKGRFEVAHDTPKGIKRDQKFQGLSKRMRIARDFHWSNLKKIYSLNT